MRLLLSQERPILFLLSVTQFPSNQEAAAILKNPPHPDTWWLHLLPLAPVTVQKTEMQLDGDALFSHYLLWHQLLLKWDNKKAFRSVWCMQMRCASGSLLEREKEKAGVFGECSKLILAYHLFHNLLDSDSLPDTCSIFNKRVLRVFGNKHAAA